jgi:hypothetical protein
LVGHRRIAYTLQCVLAGFRRRGWADKVDWIADLVPNAVAGSISLMMEEGMTVTKSTLDRLVDEK